MFGDGNVGGSMNPINAQSCKGSGRELKSAGGNCGRNEKQLDGYETAFKPQISNPPFFAYWRGYVLCGQSYGEVSGMLAYVSYHFLRLLDLST